MCWLRWLALVPMLAAGAANAQSGASASDDGVLWVLSLAALTDEDSNKNLIAGFDLGVNERTWLSLLAGRSRAPSTEADVEASLASLGIQHDFGPLGLGLRYEDWGDTDNLESETWEGEIFFGNDDYRLSLRIERRDIDIFFSGFGAPRPTDLRRFAISSDGIGLSGRYRVAPRWQVYGSWTEYDYPLGVRLVPRADRLNLLSTSAVTLAYSFVDRYTHVGFERSFGYRLFAFELASDRSAIDGVELDSMRASMLWPVAGRVDIEFSLGRSRSPGFGASVFGGLSLMVYGG